MDSYIEYPYQPRVRSLLLVGALFGSCAVMQAHIAATNHRGLLIDGVIDLSTHRATVFYWALTGICGGFAVLALLALLERLLSPEKPILRITPEEIIIPPFLFRRESRTVPLRDIRKVEVQKVKGQEFAIIRYGDRKRASITRGWLPDDAAYEHVLRTVTERAAMNPLA